MSAAEEPLVSSCGSSAAGSDLWEIYVPTHTNRGEKVTMADHKEFDAFVGALTGGLTILPTVKGIWYNTRERMIVCRVGGTKAQMIKIAEYACNLYKQDAIMFYKIGTDVTLVKRNER